jgi:HK97 gp10 family phage protein
MTIDADLVNKEIARVISDLGKYDKRVLTGIKKAITVGVIKIEADAKRLFKGRDDASVPGEPPRVDTGRARASITHEVEDDGNMIEGYAGTNVEYGPDLEFGTSRTWKHPFMTPAYNANIAGINENIAKAVKEAGNA